MRLRQLFVVALVLAAPARADEPGRVLDRAVAIVNGQVLTLSEVDFEARVLLIAAGGTEAATAELDAATVRAALEAIINNRVAAAEAEAMQAYPLDEGELPGALRAFKGRFPTQRAWVAFLERHEADESMVEGALARQLRARRVLDGKLRLRAQVSDAETRHFVELHPEYQGTPLSRVREKLFADRFKSMVASEMKVARKAAKVRLLGPYAEAGPGDGGVP